MPTDEKIAQIENALLHGGPGGAQLSQQKASKLVRASLRDVSAVAKRLSAEGRYHPARPVVAPEPPAWKEHKGALYDSNTLVPVDEPEPDMEIVPQTNAQVAMDFMTPVERAVIANAKLEGRSPEDALAEHLDKAAAERAKALEDLAVLARNPRINSKGREAVRWAHRRLI